MADTFKLIPGRVAGPACKLGHAKIVVTVAASTYATATGGLPVDFFLPFTDLGINPADVQEITGYTVLGYRADFAKGTLTASSYPWTARLWNGVAEHGEGACTQTLHANIWFYPGSK